MMEKITIVHIAQSAGGVEEYLYLLLANMDHNRYDNILILSEDYKSYKDKFKKLCKKIYFVPMQREINLKKDLYAIKEIKKILKKQNYDLLYMHSSKAGALGRLATIFKFKKKIIYNAHGWYFNAKISKSKKIIFAFIEKILALKTNIIINISKSEYNAALQWKIAKKNKMQIVENGIDFNYFKDYEKYRKIIRKKYDIKDDEIVIGVVGRISEQKDPMTTIKAFEILNKESNNFRLMFIGSGELENNVMDFAKKNNIEDKVIITNWVKSVKEYISSVDIAILPSKWEGFGLAILEYMACDKPIVATNVGGISDIIKNNLNGYLVKPEDYQELSNKILELISNKELTKKMIENNKIYRNKYSIENTAKSSMNIFEKLYNEK